MKQNNIVIVGAGLVGCLLSIFLARRGFKVTMIEKRPDLRTHSISAGRSINLSLSERGIHALKEVSLYQQVKPHLIAMPGRMLHPLNRDLHYQAYGRKASDVHYSVSRGALNQLLLDAAEHSGQVAMHFNEACAGLDLAHKQLTLHDGIRRTARSIDFDIAIGTDGAGSALRQILQNQQILQSRYEPLAHGYKELTIAAGSGKKHRMEKNALHIWPRGGFMLIALPNTDGTFTATLFLPRSGANSFESLVDENRIENFFAANFPDAVPLLPDLVTEFQKNPTGTLGTIRCDPWFADGKILLIGDASHAIVPFHGQGMNSGFEDCSAFNQCLDSFTNWDNLFEEVYRLRKPNADAIADMALENYIEMRDSVRDAKFHLRKEIEWLLEERHPNRFIPRYSMVMFHRIPSSVAQQRGRIQSRILKQLSEQIEKIEEIDLAAADRLVETKLDAL